MLDVFHASHIVEGSVDLIRATVGRLAEACANLRIQAARHIRHCICSAMHIPKGRIPMDEMRQAPAVVSRMDSDEPTRGHPCWFIVAAPLFRSRWLIIGFVRGG